MYHQPVSCVASGTNPPGFVMNANRVDYLAPRLISLASLLRRYTNFAEKYVDVNLLRDRQHGTPVPAFQVGLTPFLVDSLITETMYRMAWWVNFKCNKTSLWAKCAVQDAAATISTAALSKG